MKHFFVVHLSDIIDKLPVKSIEGNVDKSISRIDFDSRKVESGSLFVAVRGTHVDGHQYMQAAIDKGAVAIIAEEKTIELPKEVAFIQVANSSECLGLAACNFYNNPSKDLQLIGITGTNGKTTCATLLHQLFSELGYKVGLLSTVENRIGQQVLASEFTTPDAVALNELLRGMVDAGCDFAFMEVSSHAIDQGRIAGLQFNGGVFTNLSHDHLNYHKTFKAYLETKKRFFDELSKDAFALVNLDDRRGRVMVQNTKARKKGYSLRTLTDFKAKILDNGLTGLHLELDGAEFFGRLIGEFNAYNLLAVYGTAILMGMDKLEVLTNLSKVHSAEGRFDYVVDPQRQIIAIVDYAHTPDALEKVLQTIDNLKKGEEQVITVVGCGGDRDRTKRPVMAKSACEMSNQVILTSDNPRTEDPEVILEEMEKGVPPYATQKVLRITNRLQAIRTACRLAKNGDIILVAGKGHEKYQEINGVKHPFDDKQVLIEELNLTPI